MTKETKRIIRRGNVSYELIYINKVPTLVLVKEGEETKALPVDVLKELLRDTF